MEQKVILVDENDRDVGVGEKIKTHQEGKLHRAFSIFVFNSKGELLLQKRAGSKYHSGGLWSNTCCGHPRPGELTEQAAHRRLRNELKIDCDLEEIFSFTYKAKLDNGFFEHEYDHVLVGKFNDEPRPNPEEVDGWKWMDLEALNKDMEKRPESYTYWFRVSLSQVMTWLECRAPAPAMVEARDEWL